MAGHARVVLLFGGFAALLGAAFYPIYFRPLIYTEQYRMKVWSDPFNRK
ncbi:small integral membrane protein 20 isoform X2 [Rhincodon typus]|nr:small integral membrane protein 20 isoform X2 [Rhincodon typus]